MRVAVRAGKPTLSRMTGCWHEAYEAYAWSNVVCVPRKHKLYHVMERMSTRFESPTLRAAYYTDVSSCSLGVVGWFGGAWVWVWWQQDEGRGIWVRVGSPRTRSQLALLHIRFADWAPWIGTPG